MTNYYSVCQEYPDLVKNLLLLKKIHNFYPECNNFDFDISKYIENLNELLNSQKAYKKQILVCIYYLNYKIFERIRSFWTLSYFI